VFFSESDDKLADIAHDDLDVFSGLAGKVRDDGFDRFATLQLLPDIRAYWIERRDESAIDIQDGSAVLIDNSVELRYFSAHCDLLDFANAEAFNRGESLRSNGALAAKNRYNGQTY
jgi:hypothetical protein